MKIVAFSDIHGNLKSFEMAMRYIKKMRGVSAILIAGDIADFTTENLQKAYDDITKMFCLLEKLNIKYYFVLGNWDIFFVMNLEKARKRSIKAEELYRGILKKIKAKNGTLLLKDQVFKLDEKINITANKSLARDDTILLIHADRDTFSNSLLHVEGHWGLFGQVNLDKHYLNLGFLHGGKEELTGCIWEINIEGKKVRSVIWHDIGGNLKEYICPEHKNEGLFVIPSTWKKCPVCYRPERARFSKEQGKPQ